VTTEHRGPMTTGKIIGAAYLVEPTIDPQASIPPDGPVVAIAAACPVSAGSPFLSVVAWVCADPGTLRGHESWFQSDVDLRPYFHTGDPVEIDPYQGVIRHLREGYAFPVRAVR
jgi:hypothetical protein